LAPSSSGKRSVVIADFSQVALLLHSVRDDHSGSYLAALEARGIPTFCPRARAYFENDEIRLMVASFAVLASETAGHAERYECAPSD